MLQSMKYVYEVYKEKSFSKAAKNLGVSQPALSTAIKKIELEAGITLFDRSSSPLKLTEAGQAYIDAVMQVMSIQNNLKCQLSDIASLKTGSLKIGGSTFFSTFILPHAISKFSMEHPGVKIDLIEAPSADLKGKLMDETLDIIMDSCEFDSRFYTTYQVLKENLLLAVPKTFEVNNGLEEFQLTSKDIKQKKHRSEDFPCVDLSRFRNEEFLILRKGNDTGERTFAMCADAGFMPKVHMYLDQIMTSYNIACMGMGAAFVTDKIITYGYPRTEVVFYKLGGHLSKRNIVFAHKKNRYLTQVMSEFISFSKGTIYKFNKEN